MDASDLIKALQKHLARTGPSTYGESRIRFGRGNAISTWGGESMKILRRKWLQLAALSVVLAGVAAINEPAWPQTGRPIRIIIPFPPGGAADILARILSQQIGDANNQTMIVENHPGAGASIAYELTARATPDANMIVVAANSLVINPILRKTNYDPVTSYEPICNLVTSPMVFVVNSVSPYKTIGDLIAAAHAKPGTLTLAALGPATTQHIAVEQFKLVTKVDMIFVPYPGGAPVVNALLGDQVTAGLVNYSEAVQQIKAGKLRAIATASNKRIEPLPDVPTVAESGYTSYESEVWLGLFAPAKTPKKSIAQLIAWFTAAMKTPVVEAKLLPLGLYSAVVCGKDFGVFVKQRSDEYARIIHDANIKVE
jgi:tripartite-type tricarboxylate transporter receptor subunit TctC